MEPQTIYREKLTSAEAAVAAISSGSTLSMGMAIGEPPALLGALARRVDAGEVDDLRIYYFESKEHAQKTLLRYDLMDRVKPHCMFLTSIERELMDRGAREGRKVIYFVPNHFSQSVRVLSENVAIDTFLITVAPMDRQGYLSLGTNNDYASTIARRARRLLVEVNQNMPRVSGGDACLHISEVTALVENDLPLLEFTERQPKPEDEIIAQTIAELIPDRATIQLGIGTIPQSVCVHLSQHKDLGIHTELFSPGMVDLVEKGVVTNRYKTLHPLKSVFTFAMGNKRLYDFLHENPTVASHPVWYVNDPAIMAQNDTMVSVNSTVEIDLTGACNSEFLRGRQYSASGGQLDFVRGAYASRGGKSILACHSTAAGGEISRIVPRLNGPVTVPRTDVHYVVTEFGACNLKGLSAHQRALALIELAHPRFRADLHEAAEKELLL